ncbi:hypothetical protein ABW19_dt0206944 [Dactylella cylindrospora]|nr:hypothetical protein ABW19_dt0206944 [Dactylella cylindrospora]
MRRFFSVVVFVFLCASWRTAGYVMPRDPTSTQVRTSRTRPTVVPTPDGTAPGHWEYYSYWKERNNLADSEITAVKDAITFMRDTFYNETSWCNMGLEKLTGFETYGYGSPISCHNRIMIDIINFDAKKPGRRILCQSAMNIVWNTIDAIEKMTDETDNYLPQTSGWYETPGIYINIQEIARARWSGDYTSGFMVIQLLDGDCPFTTVYPEKNGPLFNGTLTRGTCDDITCFDGPNPSPLPVRMGLVTLNERR